MSFVDNFRTHLKNMQKKNGVKNWSGRVGRYSSALDLEESVFTLNDSRKIAGSLKKISYGKRVATAPVN